MADQSLTATYTASRQRSDSAEIDRWFTEQLAQPDVLGPPSPQPGQAAKPEAPKPGALGAIVKTTKDTFIDGAGNFIAGLSNRPKGITDWEGYGQQLLGVMQMTGSLGAGAGEAFRQALINFKAGMENEVAIKGGKAGEMTAAGIIRSVMGAPIAMYLDPALREEIKKNPIPFAEALNADITYGDMADLIGQVVGIPLAMKGGRMLVGKAKPGAPPPPEVLPPGTPPAAGGAPLALPERTQALVTPPPAASSAFETRLRAAKLEGPQAYSRAVADELQRALEEAPPSFSEVLREKYAAAAKAAPEAPEGPVMGPPRTPEGPLPSAAEVGMERAAGLTTLRSSLDLALKRSEQAIAETIGAPVARAKGRKAKAAEPEAPPPATPVAPAEAAAAAPEAPKIVTPTRVDPFEGMPKEEIDSVMGTLDLMHTALKEAAPGQRHLLKDDVGKVTGGLAEPSTYPDFMDAVIGKKTRANADKLMQVIDEIQAGDAPTPLHKAMVDYARAHWDEWSGQFGGFGPEGGAISPALLARMALGAAAGSTQGETAEQKIAFAFAGMGMGAVMSRTVARNVAQAYKDSGLLADESGALDFGKWRKRPAVQASEQEFQPNYRRIDAPPDVKATMKNIHRLMKEDILEKRGPARSNEKRVKEASELIAAGKVTPDRILGIREGEIWNDSEYTAMRMLSVRATTYATEVRDQVMKGAAVPEGSLQQAVGLAGAIGRNTLVMRKRIAQAEQSGAITVRGEGVGFRPQDAAELGEIAPGKTDKQLATIMSGMKPADVERFSTWMHLFPKMLLQGVYFSYLSGKAIPRNIVGNGVMIAKAPVDVGIGRFMPLWGSKKPGIISGEAVQAARAMGDAITDQVRMLRHLDQMEAAALKEGVDLSNTGLKSDRRAPAGREFVEGLTENEGLQQLGQYYDNVTTFPGTVLEQTDVASKTINARIAHRIEAFRQATFEGLVDDAFEARYAQLVDDITELSDISRQRITEFAERQTFTQEFTSKFMGYLARGPDSQWGNFVYRSFIMPFFRVTARMTESSMAHTPGLHVLTKQFWDDWNAGGRQRQIAQARVVEGAAVIGAFMYMESQGWLTGNAPKDPTRRKQWEDAGYRDRSWWDPFFEQWRSYDGLGPLTTLIAGAADTSMAGRKLPEKTMATLTQTYLMSQINTLDSRTFTQSISNFMDVIKTKNSEGQVQKSMEFLRRQMAGWLKPGLMRELETLGDPEIRRALRSGQYEEGSLQQEWNALMDDLRSGWPGFSSAKDAEGNDIVPPSRNRITGEPTIVDSWPFNPFPGTSPKDIAVTKPDGSTTGVGKEIDRLDGAGLDEWPQWLGPQAPAVSYGLRPEDPRAGVRLTRQEQDRYAVLFSQVVKNDAGQTYSQALKAAMQDPAYWEASDGVPPSAGGKAEILQRVDAEFALRAREAFYAETRSAEGEPGALERTLLEKQGERVIQKVPTAQQPEVRRTFKEQIENLRGLPSTLSR